MFLYEVSFHKYIKLEKLAVWSAVYYLFTLTTVPERDGKSNILKLSSKKGVRVNLPKGGTSDIFLMRGIH